MTPEKPIDSPMKRSEKAKTTGLTKSQRENVETFLHLFTDLEKALKVKLRRSINDRTGFSALVRIYEEKNPYWQESADLLRNFADIRNLLTHQRGTAFGYPIAVTPPLIKIIHKIKDQLLKPEPVSDRYSRSVRTVSADDTIAFVLALAFENGFSQFPVVNNGQFRGLITENEMVRWLGRESKTNTGEVNLAAVSVKMVLKEKDPDMRDIAIFHFEKLNAPVQEVMGLFAAQPALEVVLLTDSGTGNTPIKGIITQWDAARYPG